MANFFQLKGFTEALKETYGYETFYLENEKGKFPLVLIKSKLFGNRLISMPFGDYGGPEGDVPELVEEAVKKGEELKVDFIEVRAPSKPVEGFEKRDDYCTFVLNLDKSEDELFAGLEKRTRNDINKGKRSNIQILRGGKYLGEFYKLYLKTMKRLGSPPQSFKFFKNIWEKLPDNVHIALARYNGKIIAAQAYYICDGKMYYSYNCSDAKYRKLRATDLLLWSTITFAKITDLKEFDFGRTRKESGVYFSKKSWGGELREMPYYYKFINKKLEQRQEEKFEWLSKIWAKFMPGFLARLIGPWIIKQIG